MKKYNGREVIIRAKWVKDKNVLYLENIREETIAYIREDGDRVKSKIIGREETIFNNILPAIISIERQLGAEVIPPPVTSVFPPLVECKCTQRT